ncbi:cysteine-rich receptor-like protein kinase 10 [Abrus precatorius]|uniref:non-specific serine/threonine protein kinase n=1 Tax=Abrus precatorius TaxID=3816 RepID=A0A8B8LBY3_ABRPR|nr:cysteine-rich receptor-like protein kinase 10 [Abrus precatorius]
MTPLSILGFLLLFSTASAQSPIYEYSFCYNTTNNTSYQDNVRKALSWVASDSGISKGYNQTVIGSNNSSSDDTVYGFYSCRSDIVGYFCQFCLNSAAKEINQRCANNTVTAIIWYDLCIIRFSNQSFFGKLTLTPTWNTTGSKDIKDPTETTRAKDAMESLITKTIETNQTWTAGEFDWGGDNEKRYGMVQCSRDLTSAYCRECLQFCLDIYPQCCGTKVGWGVVGPSCGMKFDEYEFYQGTNDTGSPPPLPNQAEEGSNTSRKLIIGLSVLGFVALLCFSFYCFWYRKKVRKDELIPDTIPLSSYHDVQTEETLNADLPIIPLTTILQSTNNYSEACKLGEGGFGPVYKGTLPDGRQIAVKRLSKASGQGSEEFKNEVMFIAKLQHRNLVRLLACCLEEHEKILVYEYLSNASLDSHLFDYEKKKQLDWKLRLNIIHGIARGILYLHEDSRLKVIHRDLKASNVLLDHEMNPKISDFGLARAFERDQNQANTKRIMGTYGYMAPEYAMEGLFSVKTDVFSFGVLVLEIISGKKNSGFYLSEHGQSLLLYAWNIWCAGNCLELMDSVLEKSCIASEVVKCMHIGLLCVQQDAADRPTMSTVVVMLASDTMALPKPNHPAFSVGRMTPKEASTSKSSKNLSINDVTVSTILPR